LSTLQRLCAVDLLFRIQHTHNQKPTLASRTVFLIFEVSSHMSSASSDSWGGGRSRRGAANKAVRSRPTSNIYQGKDHRPSSRGGQPMGRSACCRRAQTHGPLLCIVPPSPHRAWLLASCKASPIWNWAGLSRGERGQGDLGKSAQRRQKTFDVMVLRVLIAHPPFGQAPSFWFCASSPGWHTHKRVGRLTRGQA
jgi:hypothetical protein